MRQWQTKKAYPNGPMKHNHYHQTRDEARRVRNELKRQGFQARACKREA